MRFLAFVFSLSLLMMAGCSSLSSLKKQKRISVTIEDFLKDQEKREKTISRIQGSLQIRFYNSEGSMTGGGKLVKYDSQSRLEISDPMGRVRYWLLGDPQGILAYYQNEQKAYSSGSGGTAYFRKFFGVALTWREFQDLWLGVLPLRWREKISLDYEVGDQNTQVFIQRSDVTGQVSSVRLKQDSEFWEMAFTDFDACCSANGQDLQLAHSLTLKIPGQESKIGIEWEEIKVLEETPNPAGFLRKLPQKTKLTDLK
jgi:outer membrane biogenesis lipoprotein LolB